ncbi:CHAP domain-containing protein, partial [Coprobacillus sp. TM10-10]
KVENGKVFTIEGNSKDEVREKSYNLSSKSIYGYGV